MRRRWVDIGHDYIPIRVRLTFWYVLALALALAFFALFLHIRVEPTLEEQADLAINLTAELAQYHIIVQGNQLTFEDVDQLAKLDSGLVLEVVKYVMLTCAVGLEAIALKLRSVRDCYVFRLLEINRY